MLPRDKNDKSHNCKGNSIPFEQSKPHTNEYNEKDTLHMQILTYVHK